MLSAAGVGWLLAEELKSQPLVWLNPDNPPRSPFAPDSITTIMDHLLSCSKEFQPQPLLSADLFSNIYLHPGCRATMQHQQ